MLNEHSIPSDKDSKAVMETNPFQSPSLQTRAPFLKDWPWEVVLRINEQLCSRDEVPHGPNLKSYAECEREWNSRRKIERTFLETLDWLRSFHIRTPFLHFNGNTFAEIANAISDKLFANVPQARRRRIVSLIAHHVAGVMDQAVLLRGIESLCEKAQLQAGDRVSTLRGVLHGTVLRVLPDGRIVWQTDGDALEMITFSESLVRHTPASPSRSDRP